MQTETIFIGGALGALAGDFILQPDWMAQGKKRSSVICAVHCLIWTLAVLLFAPALRGWETATWLFVTHFLIDRASFIPWSMRLLGQPQFMKPTRLDVQVLDVEVPVTADGHYRTEKQTKLVLQTGLGPWSIIVVDDIWHLLTIYLAAWWAAANP